MIDILISVLRIIFGILLVMFIPGFLLGRLIFRKQTLVERVAISIALSVFIVILLSFFLTLLSFFSPVRIDAASVMLSLFMTVMVFGSALFLRRKNEKQR